MGSSIMYQEKEFQMKDRIDRIKGHISQKSMSFKQHLERVGDKSQEILHRWEDKSREFISDFLDLFGRDTRLVSVTPYFAVTYLLEVLNIIHVSFSSFPSPTQSVIHLFVHSLVYLFIRSLIHSLCLSSVLGR